MRKILLLFVLFVYLLGSTYGQPLDQMTTVEIFQELLNNSQRQMKLSEESWNNSMDSKETLKDLSKQSENLLESWTDWRSHLDETIRKAVTEASKAESLQTETLDLLESYKIDLEKKDKTIKLYRGLSIALGATTLTTVAILILGD